MNKCTYLFMCSIGLIACSPATNENPGHQTEIIVTADCGVEDATVYVDSAIDSNTADVAVDAAIDASSDESKRSFALAYCDWYFKCLNVAATDRWTTQSNCESQVLSVAPNDCDPLCGDDLLFVTCGLDQTFPPSCVSCCVAETPCR